MNAGEPDVEQALLGAVLAGYDDVGELLRLVDGRDFYQPFHEQIWQAFGRVWGSGGRPDPHTVLAALPGAEARRLPGGPSYLHTLMQACPVQMQAPIYAEQVTEQAGRRRLVAAATHIRQAAEEAGTYREAVEEALRTVDRAVASTSHERAVPIDAIVTDVLSAAEEGQQRGLPTPWPELDALIRGSAPGRLIVPAARPGGGKSLMGVQVCVDMAVRFGHPALICSLEMPREEVTQRILAQRSGVPLRVIEEGRANAQQLDRLAAATGELSGLPVFIHDDPAQTVASIRQEIRDVQRRRDDLAIVFVDYLQYVKPADPRAQREQQVSETAAELKRSAREFGVCVWAAAQLNRQQVGRKGGEPLLSDLRESGGIEANADAVLLLHQPGQGDDMDVIVAKQRNGPLGKARLRMNGEIARLGSPGFDYEARRLSYEQRLAQ